MSLLGALFAQQNKKAPRSSLEEQTVYTVETTFTSVQQETKKKKVRRKKSSSSKPDNQATPHKKVHFANNNNGETPDAVQCHTKIVERFGDPSLWYNKKDIAAMRQAGLLTAYTNRQQIDGFSMAALKVLQPGAGKEESKENGKQLMNQLAVVADMRGLESFMAPQIQQVVQSQITGTLATHRRAKDDHAAVRMEARRISKRCAKMARQLAMHDAKEALKASFSTWRPQPDPEKPAQ